MTGTTTIVAGIEVPSVSPVFLTMVAFHVVVGMACVITGAGAIDRTGNGPNGYLAGDRSARSVAMRPA